MSTQLVNKGIAWNEDVLQALHSMLEGKQLAITFSKKGVLTVEELFTLEHKRIVFRCELDIEVDKKRHVSSSRRNNKLREAAQSAFSSTLDQLAYLNQFSLAS